MQFNIRRAVREDCPAMMGLVNELAAYERAPEEVTVDLAHFMDSGFGERPVWWAFVAEVDGLVVGFALYYIRYSTWKGQRMYLEDLYIKPDYRRMGIGDGFMQVLIEEAKERNFAGIVWQVLDWNELAIGFYKKYPTSFDGEWVNCALNFSHK